MNRNAKSLRIAIVSGSLATPTFIANLANGLQKSGHRVAMVGRDYGKKNRSGLYEKIATDYARLNSIHLLWRLFALAVVSPGALVKALRSSAGQQLTLSLRIKKIFWYLRIFRFNPDVVHFQWVTHLMQFREILALKRTVLSLRGRQVSVTALIDPGFRRKLEELFPHVHGIHAVSQDLGDRAVQLKAVPERVAVIHSIVPENLFRTIGKRLRGTPMMFLSVGRFHWKKGYRSAIDALHGMMKRGEISDFIYTIIAHGDISSEILFQVQDLDMEGRVRIINGLPHKGVMQMMQEMDLLILPSYSEGIANVVIEAMASGLPVLSADGGGMGEVIMSGKNGWLYRRYDIRSFEEKMREFLTTDAADLLRIRHAAQDLAKSMFAEAQQVRKFEQLYEKVLNPGT